MVNAIVAGEDKNFFVNPWIDFGWLLRAVFNYATGRSDKIEGTSTISQQLIRNVFLSNERKVERKIKELYLSYAMTQEYSKEKILELYLNKISFGNNAFGVEQASLTYFWKHIRDIGILEGSLLASIPKWPTYYSPYNHYDRLMGDLYVFPKGNETNSIELTTPTLVKENIALVDKFKTLINSFQTTRLWDSALKICGLKQDDFKNKLKIDSNGCSIQEYSALLAFLNSIRLTDGENNIEYQIGRKDFILWRMLEDEHITWEQYKIALIQGIGFEFHSYQENIKHPHFVMYVREYLSEKYWEQILEEWGLKIYTTLDSNLQIKAEQIISKQVTTNKEKFDANNAALVSIDNTNGDILAFVGGADYFNKEIGGNVNMITAKRQPWSSFKPYVYALAIDKNAYCANTPIYDLPTTFPWGYTPNNYNGKFEGKMSLMTALNHSRNIPAIKLYFMAGKQAGILDYLKQAGVKSLDANFPYGASLALGSGEMTPLEMAGAYSVFPNNGKKVPINPIIKILDSKGLVIEEKKQVTGKEVLTPSTAYIMDSILSNAASRPSDFWNANLTLIGRLAWAKTGTSNKVYLLNGKKDLYPWDLWTVGFTKQITTAVWAGNTDGKRIKQTWDGLNGAAPIWKEFMEYAHKGKKALDWEKPAGTKSAYISTISGLLAPSWYPKEYTAWCAFTNLPTSYDQSLQEIQVDMMCNGKVSANTPPWAIKTGYLVNLRDIDPTNTIWQAGVTEWAKNGGASKLYNGRNIITNYSGEECVRNESLVVGANVTISSNVPDWSQFVKGNNYVELSYNSKNPLRSIQVLLDENLIEEIDISNEKVGNYQWNISIPEDTSEGTHLLTFRAVDSIYVSAEDSKQIKLGNKDISAPKIVITNPQNKQIALFQDQYFNLRGYADETSKIKVINIYLDGKALKMGIESREFAIEINSDHSLAIGTHEIKVEAVDLFFNKGSTIVSLEIMPR